MFTIVFFFIAFSVISALIFMISFLLLTLFLLLLFFFFSSCIRCKVRLSIYVPSMSLFSQVLWKFCNQILLYFKASVPLPDLQVGKSDLQPRTFTTEWKLLWYIVLQFMGRPPLRYGVWFYYDCIPPISLQLLPCPWMCIMFLFVCFDGFQCPLINGSSTVGHDFGILWTLPFSWETCMQVKKQS